MCVLMLAGAVCGRSTTSGEMSVCNSISMEIEWDFLDLGKEIPTSWGELQGVKMLREGSLNQSVKGLSIYNKFAIVPEAPEIRDTSGIPKEYVGMHLFLIQRQTEPPGIYTYAGRAAILIGPKTADPKDRRIMATFLQEKVAQIMISQIEGFDPKNQPLAFDREFISELVERKKEVRQEIEHEVFPERRSRVKKRPKSEVEEANNSVVGAWVNSRSILFFVAVLAIITGCLICRKN